MARSLAAAPGSRTGRRRSAASTRRSTRFRPQPGSPALVPLRYGEPDVVDEASPTGARVDLVCACAWRPVGDAGANAMIAQEAPSAKRGCRVRWSAVCDLVRMSASSVCLIRAIRIGRCLAGVTDGLRHDRRKRHAVGLARDVDRAQTRRGRAAASTHDLVGAGRGDIGRRITGSDDADRHRTARRLRARTPLRSG